MKVDARGEQCPIPVIKAKKALESAKKGDLVVVFVDNEIAVQNLQKLATQKNEGFQWKKNGDSEYEAVFTVGNSDSAQEEELEISCEMPTLNRKKKTVVAIASNQMGVGEEALGKTLLKGFLYALTQQDVLPDTILFYNGGASISCEGSDSLEDLKWLEQQGVEIITCGTCLNFYGIAEKLAVGKVTNMYEIVQTMMSADSLIKP
ncbi:MAG TPA: sulfurtransferase-like selenium metabolism protein YedF [Candidatus Fimimorpha faecalis]|uniref:Sulfurtransferase-like selenium metabolism protein YedF n=1 Tax=Candidatus Fimimorpha faecalis TaxID=2840824 RepID=A0A9D1ECR5_9FIRM|nr:sulfurtransferase-like selenium metabolism protein YedF [Candidatus Fimimorpha faecalis]